jgi:hypothetical protein
MNIIEQIIAWFRGLFRTSGSVSQPKSELPPLHFKSITSVLKPPKNEQIEISKLYFVSSHGKPKWCLFRCPCSCGDVVTLSLQSVHNPHWTLSQTERSQPTLYPSVWRDKGCLSHFWVKEGRIFWCTDTGSHPSLRFSARR